MGTWVLDLLRARHTTIAVEAPRDLSRCENTVRATSDRCFSLNGASDQRRATASRCRGARRLRAAPSRQHGAAPPRIANLASSTPPNSVAPWNGDRASSHRRFGVSCDPLSAPSISRSTSAVASSLSSGAKDASWSRLLRSCVASSNSSDGEGCGPGQNGARPCSRTNVLQASTSSPPLLDVTSLALLHSRKAPSRNLVGAANFPEAATDPQTSTSSSSLSDSESDK